MFVQTETESYSRHAEEIAMERKAFTSEDLDAFIENVLEPSESFARLVQNAHVDMVLRYGKAEIKADFYDLAQVSGALNSLTRQRLLAFAARLQEQVGEVHVVQTERDIVVDHDVTEVLVGGKVPEPSRQ
jgi:hypothetical protein